MLCVACEASEAREARTPAPGMMGGMRPHRPVRALAAALAIAAAAAACSGEQQPGPGEASSAAPTASATIEDAQSPSPLEETEVPFTETDEPAPQDSDVPATLYAVVAERLDPRSEHLAAYDGSNDPASGVGAGEVPGGWSLNAEWRPRGLVGVVVADDWPDGWLCVDAYPGCREITVPDVEGVTGGGAIAQALATGRSGISVGFATAGGKKVIVSSVDVNELSATDLAVAAADERLDLP